MDRIVPPRIGPRRQAIEQPPEPAAPVAPPPSTAPGCGCSAPEPVVQAAAPKVTAIMPLADMRRFRLASRAIGQFVQQTYQNRELIIVNSTGRRLTAKDTDMGRELEVSPADYPTLGDLRNLAIREAAGEWCILWDDDDHSHPHRIAFQMAHRREDHAVLLTHQLRVDVRESVACVWTEPEGIPGTILFPRPCTRGPLPLFDGTLTQGGEDEAFADQFSVRKVLLNNGTHWFPGPGLMVAFWHGLNVKSREAFLGKYAAPEHSRVRQPEFTDDLTEYLKDVLTGYGMEVHEGTTADSPSRA